ncbi:MAG: PqqD family protein [Ardenticatenaceae bacterium]
MSSQQAELSGRYAQRKSGVLTKQVSKEMVIVDIKQGIYHGLNTIGVQIWEQLDGKRSLSQIADDLVEWYPEVERARIEADTLTLIQALLDNDLVVAS